MEKTDGWVDYGLGRTGSTSSNKHILLLPFLFDNLAPSWVLVQHTEVDSSRQELLENTSTQG